MSDIAAEMQALALEAQRFSRKHLVLELDFSEASVGLIEATADTVEYAIRGGKSEQNIELLSRIWGAYIGEALRKVAGGEWVAEPEGRVALCGPRTSTYPHEQVRKRLTAGKAHDLAAYFRQTKEQL